MKAISLTQPWATLVVTGRKAFETRSWPTTVRERIAIHASKAMPGWAREAAVELGLDPDSLPRGAVLGEVTIQECVPTTEALRWISRNELPLGDYSPGRFAWGLIAPTEYPEPVSATGALGFWDWPAPSYDQVLGELRARADDPLISYTDPAGGPDWEPRRDEA